ncbi:hypothetical protein GXM_02376 [Nostoc sphaeroides CCNUC1]|uniref:Uncharacterized protein n=1 Tax=Nostoc sphaeroides CCNUC1 TaxID=2653204 RepID=A0A5P8VX44_9NOSO|nr:hypothetical protein GXM_02376 [Nostoc sphaeroides CCNUC1]
MKLESAIASAFPKDCNYLKSLLGIETLYWGETNSCMAKLQLPKIPIRD